MMISYILKKKSFGVTIILFCLSLFLFSQENQLLSKNISGKVTYHNAPLENVNIIILDTKTGTKTDAQGYYTIKTQVGDLIQYSHVGFKSITIVVEDVTTVLNIEMDNNVSELDEIVLTIRKKVEKVPDYHEVMNIDLQTSFGTINPLRSASAVHYLSNTNLRHISSPSLEDMLNGRFSRVEKRGDRLYIRGAPAKFDIDGQLYERDPGIVFSNIEHLFIMKSKALVIIRTKDAPEEIKKRQEAKAEQYRNQNYYNENAVNANNETVFSNALRNKNKSIRGRVTSFNMPLVNVNIIIKGTSIGTKTNTKGEYIIKAKIGDIIEYSHISFKTVAIMIEDVTTTLNIEMISKTNILDQIVVKARKKPSKVSKLEKKLDVDLITPFGTFNPKKSGFAISYLDGKTLNQSHPSIATALGGKFAGVREISGQLFIRDSPAKYVIDGVESSFASQLNLSSIEDIYIVKIKALVIIRTNNSFDVLEAKRKEVAEQYTNQNYYTDDAEVTNNESSFSSTNAVKDQYNYIITKNISGKVTYLDAPMPLVNIVVIGKTTGAKTNTKGEYKIKANVGDIIQFSHLGFATVSIIVEDVTKVLDIEMVLKENELNEVTITADGKIGKELEQSRKANETFSTSLGNMDPKRTGFAMSFLNGENVSSIYNTLGEALDGKMSGVKYDYVAKKLIVKPISSLNTPLYAIWDVDGVIYDEEPPIDLNNVKSVRILKTLAGTNRYGSEGAGGVVLVQTINGDFNPIEAKRKKVAEQYTNKNYYSNDASIVSLENLNSNAYADALEAFNNKQKAYIYYYQTLKHIVKSYSDHISIAQKFITFYKDENLAREVFNKVTETYNKNPEILKAVAYHLQALGLKKDAIKAYEIIFKLRPKHVQSYRDLANAYVGNDQFKKAWRLYMSYLLQGNDISGENIGQLLYNEMEYLYYNRKNQTDIKEHFVPQSDDLFDFRNDVRIVFEWNTSEAEFDLEFVNPEKRAYVFEHSLAANQELITNEKQKGYSSKEFFIDDIGNGEWLVNISYKGNKKPEPTYFKVTQYFNWGKANQTKEITVYKLQEQRNKMQLLRLNKQLLIAVN